MGMEVIEDSITTEAKGVAITDFAFLSYKNKNKSCIIRSKGIKL